ncbi:hypothetical protein C8Q72DRAFT_884778 [Fomitopsis betulina]|nr:hypothetical protein C8Q72DRAFT_929216 [Fomitopsis betulina]KAI0729090.1 hypothetical protein C8Q72DRAFT_884778 [Fomitopsis betulina]
MCGCLRLLLRIREAQWHPSRLPSLSLPLPPPACSPHSSVRLPLSRETLATATAKQIKLQTARKVSKVSKISQLPQQRLAHQVWRLAPQPHWLLRARVAHLCSDLFSGSAVHAPIGDVLPVVHLDNLILGGWDISRARMDEAVKSAYALNWDHVVPGMDKQAHLEHLHVDICHFKAKCRVFWTTNMECYACAIPGVNDTADAVLDSM